MQFNNYGSRDAIIDYRRRAVSALRVRGLTVREILAELPRLDPPVVNEKDNKPWSIGIIHSDLKALSKEWQEAASAHTDELKANILAGIREARRAAWETDRLDLVLRSLKDERELFGLDAPTRSELSAPGGGPIIAILPAVRDDETVETE